MAMFRAITAEEAAASGLMQCLVHLNYPLSENLRPKDHLQKHGVTPFLQAVLLYFSHIKLNGVDEIRLAIKEIDGVERLVTAIQVAPEGDQMWVTPSPPLNLRVRQGEDLKNPTFKSDFQRVIEPRGYKNILQFIKTEANLRNTILYAGNDGFP